jgi:acetate kinase
VRLLASTLGGLDAIVFTAGIGEHQPSVRASVCQRLGWLGAEIDRDANADNAMRIDAPQSRITLLVIPTDEEQTIADETLEVLQQSRTRR